MYEYALNHGSSPILKSFPSYNQYKHLGLFRILLVVHVHTDSSYKATNTYTYICPCVRRVTADICTRTA